MQLGKTRLAHDALAHNASGNAHDAAVLGCCRLAHIVALLVLTYDGQVDKVADDVCAPYRYGKFGRWIGLNAHVAQRLHILAANNFLFAQLKYFQVHIW